MNFLDEFEKVEKKLVKKEKNTAKNYGVVISFKDKKVIFNFIKIGKKADLKNDYLSFSKNEKRVFNLIQNAKKWKEEIDLDILFENLENSKFEIFYKKEKIQKLSFDKKLKLQLNFELKKDAFTFPEKKNDFVLKISEKNFEEVIITSNSIYFIQDERIGKISSQNKEIFQIILRIFKKIYTKRNKLYSTEYKTSLSAEEILKINLIQKELENIFILEKNWNENFEIQEVQTQKEILEINYSHQENFIEIIPYIDYGVEKIPLSKSVKFIKTKFGGNFKRVFRDELGFDYLIKIEKNKIFWNKVNYKKEIEFFKHLFALKNELSFNSKLDLKRQGARQLKLFLEKNWKNIKTLPFEKIYLNEKIDFEFVKFKAEIDLDVKSSKSLLELKTELFLGDEKISLNELKEYARKKDSYIKRADGSLIKVENEKELEKLISVLEKFREKDKKGFFEGKLYQITELENIFSNSEYYKTKRDEGYKKFLKEIEKVQKNQKVVDLKIPKGSEKLLRKYQIDGIYWMSFLKKYHFGGILADDMGLGKTIQALILLSLNKEASKPSLVVAPKSVLENWFLEAQKFTPELKTILINGSISEREQQIKKLKNYDLVLTSYPLLQRDFEFYQKNEIKFNYLILDEAQYIKNFRTRNSKIVKEIDSDYRLALSGTPLENSVSEIWSIFEFLMPGFLGSQSEFQKKYITPISHGNKEVLTELQKKISFFMMRRVKKDVLEELPEKIEQKLFVELKPEQKILYQEILTKIKKEFLEDLDEKSFKKSYMNILAALTRLRQICNHPNLILKEENYKKYESGKLELFNNLVNELIAENRKILIFSQFTSMLDILEKEIETRNISYSRLDGSTSNRQKLIEEFNQNENKKIFLISLKAGGVGLNLTSADSVIIFDPWWNPSVENQAIDRAHRIGQKKSVNVYKLISKDSIEEKILELQKEKVALFDGLINKTETNFRKLEWKDIKNIFEI